MRVFPWQSRWNNQKNSSKLTNEINFIELDFDLLETIREQHLESLKELVKLTNENINTIKPKIDHLTKTRIVEFK